MDFAVTPKYFAEPANNLPVAPTAIGKTLKPLSVGRKAVPVTAKEIATRWKGKGRPSNANGRLAPAVANLCREKKG
ncbi:MAG: hypothetical protein QOH06_1151 [Acidobacteriota bacterium]|jgi:hypothetical protein|nr:hypothetical protein [Acidobacteriota bacterium]